jgi:hypothetical protein
MSKEAKAEKPKGARRQVSADEKTRRGVYANESIVAHGREEFTMDFCFFSGLHPGQGQLVSRLILSPGHTKRFLQALQENVRRYEERFGEIELPAIPAGQEPPIVQ